MDDFADLDELVYQNDLLFPNQQQQFGTFPSYQQGNKDDVVMNDGDNSNNPPVHHMKKLSNDTIRRIQSEQVITDISSCVKELLENSIDAKATRIEIILEKSGLELIKVKDNGVGIPEEDHKTVCCPHYTSKIEDFSDLEKLTTYGFRGEALSSLANLSGELQIITRTNQDSQACLLSFEKDGNLRSKEKCPTEEFIGTSVISKKLMDNFAVRREVLQKNVKLQMRKIGDILLTYSLIRPDVQIICKDDGKPIVVGRKMNSIGESVKLNFGPMISDNLMNFQLSKDGSPYRVSGFLPQPDAEVKEILRSNSDRQFIYVNSRPVSQPTITKMLNQHIRRHFNDNKRRYPVFLIHIECDPSEYDVNYVPNKDKLQLHNEAGLKTMIEEYLVSTYTAVHPPPPPAPRSPPQTAPIMDIGATSNLISDHPSSPLSLPYGDNEEEEQPLLLKQNKSGNSNSFVPRNTNTAVSSGSGSGSFSGSGSYKSSSNSNSMSSNAGTFPHKSSKSSQSTMDTFTSNKQAAQKSPSSSSSNKRKRNSDFVDDLDELLLQDEDGDKYANIRYFYQMIISEIRSDNESNRNAGENLEFEGEISIDVNLQKVQSEFLSLMSTNPAQTIEVVDNPHPAPIKLSKDDLKEITVVGKVDDFNEFSTSVVFICKLKDQLLMFDPIRAEEALNYNEAKTTLKFPIEKLDSPIRLTEASIGGKQNWDLASRSVVDEALLYNGFKLLRISENGKLQLFISGITKQIPGYGIHDLVHLLNILVQTGDVTVSPNEYIPRTPEALKYLAETATKNSQKLTANMSRFDVENIIKRLCLTSGPAMDTCPHKQPLFIPLRQWKIPN